MLELKDTIQGMTDPHYKERFKAEYQQVAIRIRKLEDLLRKEALGELDFRLACPLNILNTQLWHMKGYRDILERRAELENITLEDVK